MGIKETVLGWLRTSPDKSEDLEGAELDELSNEYGMRRGDVETELRSGGSAREFESDQNAPRN